MIHTARYVARTVEAGTTVSAADVCSAGWHGSHTFGISTAGADGVLEPTESPAQARTGRTSLGT